MDIIARIEGKGSDRIASISSIDVQLINVTVMLLYVPADKPEIIPIFETTTTDSICGVAVASS